MAKVTSAIEPSTAVDQHDLQGEAEANGKSDNAPTTAARQLWNFACRMGIDVLFANLGSDHPAFIESFADLEGSGPRIVICPHEITALSAAHGYAMNTQKPQMVLVHVDVGTANLGGSVHNAARSRIPAIIVAGRSPATLAGDLIGTRTEFIHFIQDTPHQEDIVRPYVKWSYELREASTVEGVFLRAHQLASSEPQGPVYITGAREVWDKDAGPSREDPALWSPARLSGVSQEVARLIAEALSSAQRPLVLTSYLGRNPAAFEALKELSERVGIGVLEIVPAYTNFPGDHRNHLGHELNAHVNEADVILLIDIDVPWLPLKTAPAPGARVFHIDSDPLKSNLLFWHYPVDASYTADSAIALGEVLACLEQNVEGREERENWITSIAPKREPNGEDVCLSEAVVAEALRSLAHENTVFVVEEPSGTIPIWDGLRPGRSKSAYGNGGTSLGWGINAALGTKLARPDAEVIAVVGDGAFVFGVPPSTYWVSKSYDLPFLTVICNNDGWNSPKLSTELVHPKGKAVADDRFWVTMTHGMKLPEIAAAAGDAASFRVTDPRELLSTLQAALGVVRGGRSAVVDVVLTPISRQTLQ